MHLPIILSLVTTFAAFAQAGCPLTASRERQAAVAPDLKNRATEAKTQKRQLPIPNFDEKTENNCGPFSCDIFDAAKQFVDVRPGSGYEYQDPKTGDKRGPCPGLNAAANHGFIERNGIVDIVKLAEGLNKAYAMGLDLATVLAVVGVGLTGDPTALAWSIGGPFNPLSPLGQQPSGISYSHNSYEGDGSITRADAYMYNDPNSVNPSRFRRLIAKAENDNLTPTIMRNHSKEMNTLGRETNGYFFIGAASGIVAPAAGQFIVNFFSNHSQESPNGYLNKATLKSFFGVTGNDNNLVYKFGTERIPLNWYRRHPDRAYGVANLAADLAIIGAKYPEVFSFGGNTGQPNTFTGVDVSDLTDGVFNAKTLFQGNNLACFLFQVQQTQIVARLDVLGLQPLLDTLKGFLSPILKPLACPQLANLNQTKFNQFPGFLQRPVGPK
ncbi:hypothetical protein P280DRAFT_454391 [Massarina eburnea CBS 473.64]|uniref:Heme haloperoxidase family profile domain-containing protein n=1 Tax=Massarina eburnea CBS 473.64 TaxID=1395130 RepID=A0A6A6RW42_9PLEO|nr:hypothetical protein P280DRAFT_454391 [Massarina eburnea CBS 473.64]